MRGSGKRDDDWFSAVYAAHYPKIVKYGLRRLGDLESSIELAQEVFVVAWRRRARVPPEALPWLYAVARRLLANHWRAHRAAPVLVPMNELHPSAGLSEPDAAADLALVTAALATLSDLDQEILRLVGWEELTVAEAATVLGCSRPTAAVRLHRARRRLTEAMRRACVPMPFPERTNS
jgi:RNA polymerase sigma factor (sigma-70 family)